MSASQSPEEPRISRRALLQGAGVAGLSAASGTWLRPSPAVAAGASKIPRAAPRHHASADHLVTNYRPSQPTGWPPEQHVRNGVGVTIGGHLASVPFTLQGATYEISLLSFGQPGNAPDPVYEGEPSDPMIDFKATLQKVWGAYYAFNYTGGFTGDTAISVQSYSVKATAIAKASATQLNYGCDLFLVYEPDPTSSDPPITADLRWIEVSNSGGKSSTEFAQRACPYYFPGGLTSVYGKPACSFYGAPQGGIAAPTTGKGPTGGKGPATSGQVMFESFLVLDAGRQDHAGKGIVDIYGGVKWGYQVRAPQS